MSSATTWMKSGAIGVVGGIALLATAAGTAAASGPEREGRAGKKVECAALLEAAQYTAIDTSMCNRPQPNVILGAGGVWQLSYSFAAYPYGVDGYAPYGYYPYGYYANGGAMISSYNLAPATYVVVMATAEALGIDPVYVYNRIAAGESLDSIAAYVGVSESVFQSRFATALEVRISEALVNGTMQSWQAAAVRAHVASGWIFDSANLLPVLNQLV